MVVEKERQRYQELFDFAPDALVTHNETTLTAVKSTTEHLTIPRANARYF
ncbi:hypothetical protein ACEYW6_12850 [Nostoc sp. UIC 10607]|nr:hypothetical protein [Nostoc sp. NZL]